MFPNAVGGRRVCVIREDVTNQQGPAAKREQAERVARGREPAAISTSESPGLASPGAPGEGAEAISRYSPPHLANEETDSAVECPPQGRGRFVQNEGGRGRESPAWRMLLPHLSASSFGP